MVNDRENAKPANEFQKAAPGRSTLLATGLHDPLIDRRETRRRPDNTRIGHLLRR
jgi:hypothetical protein